MIDAYVPTRILPGAFTKTLQENGKRIKVLYQHDAHEPIGKALVLREDKRGLYIKAQLSSTQRGQDVAALLRDGVLNELSIGFDTLKHTMVHEGALGQVRHISEVRLWEVSLVTHAANPDAVVTQVHARGGQRIAQLLAEFDRLALDFAQCEAHRRDDTVRQLEVGLLEARRGRLRLTPRPSSN